MTRILALGMINHCFAFFNNRKLTQLDKRLLKGFYVRDKRELDHDSGNSDKERNISRKEMIEQWIKGAEASKQDS